MGHPKGRLSPSSVSVVIPCRDEAGTIVALLDAIEQQDEWPLEIVVVDDGSTDGTAALAAGWGRWRKRPVVRLVRTEGIGVAAAMNAGIRAAQGDVIIRLDGHCRPRAGYISRSIATLRRPRAGVVGGVWEIEPGAATTVARAIAEAVSHPAGSGGAAYRGRRPAQAIREVDTVPFGCFRRALWEILGGYDESLMSNEDYDFNYRARCAGFDVLLNTEIRCTYGARATLRALARQYFRYGYWKTQMLRKSPKALRLRQLPPALVLPWVVATILMIITVSGVLPLLAATVYPSFLGAAAIQIARERGDMRLLLPLFAALLIQHGAWSAGFWRGMLYSAPRPT